MSRKPQTHHGKVLAAFVKGQITRKEYILCVRGLGYVSGRTLVTVNGMRRFPDRKSDPSQEDLAIRFL